MTIATYSYADAQPFTVATTPADLTRKVVSVDRDGTHRPFSAVSVIRYVALYGEEPELRWAYALPCDCEACAWTPPGTPSADQGLVAAITAAAREVPRVLAQQERA